MRITETNAMRFIGVSFAITVALGALAVCLFARPTGVAANSDTKPVPVLVELFTSEGCSSCPPADDLIARLDATQFVPGARAIVLSEHVTYWNSLGWRDPFSFDQMTQRQETYASRLGLDSAYTPQAVVDGRAEFVGSDQRKLTRAVAEAATTPKVPLSIDHAMLSAGSVHFAVHSQVGSGQTLIAAIADDSAQSSVARGENSGHTLRHVAVVRSLQELDGSKADGRELSLKAPVSNSTQRLVVFVIERRSGRVLAVDEQSIDK